MKQRQFVNRLSQYLTMGILLQPNNFINHQRVQVQIKTHSLVPILRLVIQSLGCNHLWNCIVNLLNEGCLMLNYSPRTLQQYNHLHSCSSNTVNNGLILWRLKGNYKSSNQYNFSSKYYLLPLTMVTSVYILPRPKYACHKIYLNSNSIV